MVTFSSGMELSYAGSGLFKSAGQWIHPQRVIDTYEIIFMIKGEAYIFERDNKYALSENDVLLLEPNAVHGGYERTSNVSFFWMHFNAPVWTGEIPKLMKSGASSALKTMFSQLLHISNTPGYDAECADIACAMILKELAFESKNEIASSGSLAAELKEWIRLNINKELSVKKISDVFGYHENHISRVFKRAYGVGIKDYIVSLKIKSAESLLQTTLYTIKQISFMTGFKSENHFIKFFEYHKKMTPREYRNAFVNTHINNE